MLKPLENRGFFITYCPARCINRINAYQRVIAAGVCVDKARLIKGKSSANIATILADACRKGWEEQFRDRQRVTGERETEDDSEV